MHILGIDPGPVTSGYVHAEFSGERGRVVIHTSHADLKNEDIAFILRTWVRDFRGPYRIAIESPMAIYSTVGQSTIETIKWTGEFRSLARPHVTEVSPQEVRLAICGTAQAKDPGVRQALIDRYGPRGTIKKKGQLYAVTKHAWRALAVAVVVLDREANRNDLTSAPAATTVKSP